MFQLSTLVESIDLHVSISGVYSYPRSNKSKGCRENRTSKGKRHHSYSCAFLVGFFSVLLDSHNTMQKKCIGVAVEVRFASALACKTDRLTKPVIVTITTQISRRACGHRGIRLTLHHLDHLVGDSPIPASSGIRV